MKKIAVASVSLLALIAAFGAGFNYGGSHSQTAQYAQIDMGIRVARDVKKHFGEIDSSDPDYKNIVGTIHLVKDMDLAVVKSGDQKTVRVYK